VAQNKRRTKSGGKGRETKRSTKTTSSVKPKRSGASRRVIAAADSAGEEEVSIDRRRRDDRRGGAEQAIEQSPVATEQLERRKKVNRRRQIDPTTCERDYTEEEVEFMNALDDYKRKSGRMFPTCSEVLEVVRHLGYVKLPRTEFEALGGLNLSATSAKPMVGHWPSPEAAEVTAAAERFERDSEAGLAY
jgi:hypothetical protein